MPRARSRKREDGFGDGARAALPVVLGYLSLGLAAGVVQRAAGLSVLEIVLLSLLLYAGAAQFITAGMIAAGSPLTAIVTTVFFVNLRNLLFSLALALRFERLRPWEGLLIGAQLTDETFAVASAYRGKRRHLAAPWMLGLNVPAYAAWALANLAGALSGGLVGRAAWLGGLDFALPAMLGGLLMLQLDARRDSAAVLVAALLAAALVVGLSVLGVGGWVVILGTVIAATAGLLLERVTARRKAR